MNRKEMLLTILAEECIETAQRVSKAIRFGADEVQPDQPFTNAERIVYEFNDIVALMEMLKQEGVLPAVFDESAVELKVLKVDKYLRYSDECGTLTN